MLKVMPIYSEPGRLISLEVRVVPCEYQGSEPIDGSEDFAGDSTRFELQAFPEAVQGSGDPLRQDRTDEETGAD